MVAKRKKASKTRLAVRVMLVACASLVVVGCIGFGIASAQDGPSDDGAFGVDKISAASVALSDNQDLQVSDAAREEVVLASSTQRDISQGVNEIAAEEEAARIAAEEAARKEAAEREAAEAAAKAEREAAAAAAQADQDAASLSDVDWSVGRDAFIEEWSARIDNYLAGSPLAGQGSVFATAAWEYQVDPRWSPAISNTESSKGAHCFKSHNAWGWGSSSWSSWDEAINAHVSGLARVYGYSITYNNAKKYCPPNYDNWYKDMLREMRKI